MGAVTRNTKGGGTTSIQDGQPNIAADVETDIATLFTEANGLLDDANIETATIPGAKSLRFTEIAAPSAPAANDIVAYGVDDGAGVTLVATKDSSSRIFLLGRDSRLGTATTAARAIGVINNEAWSGATTAADTNETVGATFSLPANAMSANDDMLYVRAWFRTSANTNTKRFRVYFGATAVLDTGAVAMNNQSGTLEAWIGRIDATNQFGTGVAEWSTTSTAGTPTRLQAAVALTATHSGAITVQVTMLNGTAAAGDCRLDGMVAAIYPAYQP
jgi:hypothetical protein